MNFEEIVKQELIKARNNHGPMNSIHEGLAVLWEEFEEFKNEVFLKRHDKGKMLIELAQISAVCQRIAEDNRLW